MAHGNDQAVSRRYWICIENPEGKVVLFNYSRVWDAAEWAVCRWHVDGWVIDQIKRGDVSLEFPSKGVPKLVEKAVTLARVGRSTFSTEKCQLRAGMLQRYFGSSGMSSILIRLLRHIAEIE